MSEQLHNRPSHDGGGLSEAEGPKFTSLGLHPDLLKGLTEMGFERPTPIQVKAIPAVLTGRDVVGSAQTGTGKTAAFVLPILHRLMSRPGKGHMRALIIAPTRELALQSMQHLRSLSKYVPLKGAAIFGGVPMDPQIQALRNGIDIVSATPGRLLDHIYSGRIDFVDLEIFVLDEADRMLDMGFLPDIHKIIRLLPKNRQNLLFSATMPPEIRALANEFLRDPVTIEIGHRTAPAAGVRQAIYPVARNQKIELLTRLLKQPDMDSVLVFTRTKIYADRLTDRLKSAGIKVSVLHGDRSQSQRLQAIEQFRRGKSQVLVATDIAARGIDISDISHVINFDIPGTAEDYIHRVGRTARAEQTGDAFTLVDPQEEPLVRDIEKVIGRELPRVTIEGFTYRDAPPPAPRHGERHDGRRHHASPPRGRHGGGPRRRPRR